MQRFGLFEAVKLQRSGNQCITDVPSAILKTNSYVQCVGQCIAQGSCDDINVVDDGNDGSFDCQLYNADRLLHYGVQSGCSGYQVW